MSRFFDRFGKKIKRKFEVIEYFIFLHLNDWVRIFVVEVNRQIPNLRHLLYSIIVILDKCHDNDLIDRIYLERFRMIYEIWMLIDNELNQRENRSISIEKSKRTTSTTTTTNQIPSKLTWNFLIECQTYEQIFGAFTNSST